jgi:two-component system LytT family response regulator
MNKLNTVIIDDEEKSRDTLRQMLSLFCKNTQIIGEAKDVRTGVELLSIVKPDLVFLDIKMPDGNGFDLLRKLKTRNFNLIFTTAFDQYAIKAFKFNAIDYLLKPIDADELKAAVKKAENNTATNKANVDNLINNAAEVKEEDQKIILSTSEGIHIIKVKNIIRCQADDYYTNFFLNDGRKIMISKTLKESEELLVDYKFIRPHRSHLVNISYIKKYVKSDGGYIVLADGTKIPVSRRKKDVMVEYLKGI